MNRTGKMISVCALLAAAGLTLTACESKEKEVVSEVIVQTTEAPTEPPTMPIYDEYVPSVDGMTEKTDILLKKNKNYAGWIRIKNTSVDYPFLKDPGEIQEGQPYYRNEFHDANSFYLHKDFERNYEFAGSLFMDYRDEFGAVDETQSENIVIYGHNMLNLTMFGSLRNYYNDHSFWEQAAFIELSSQYADYDYVVCGNAITSGYKESDFVYWDMEELDTQEDFDFYKNKLREKQVFDTGVDVKFGDKLLTLSTCYGDSDANLRFILVARRLREGEVAGDLSTIQRTDEYIKKHKEKEKTTKEIS
ncbi:MAG: class B sortase [Ruminococcus sp.]|nr:class B sortase [Ruminococcus sp.]